MPTTALSRRRFLARSAAAAASAFALPGCLVQVPPKSQGINLAFWHVSDTHFLADVANPGRVDPASLSLNAYLIELLNTLPGSDLPANVGGGTLAKPVGVIHTGDLIDSGDKVGAKYDQMQQTEWATYAEHFGLAGGDGKLKYPVYELYGNHDAPHGKGVVLDRMRERTPKRPGLAGVSKNGLHYSWDWQGVHFVSLGITVGGSPATRRKRTFEAYESYDFLVTDLADRVGQSGRPVILCHHINLDRWTTVACDPAAPNPVPGAARLDWDPCDVHAFHEALAGYNVIAILYGHTHGRKIYKWDGQTATAKTGIDVFNVDDASHFKGPAHGILHYHLTDTTMTVREYSTKDHWKTAAWTQAWTMPIKVPANA
jgi:cytolysin (calcineurin-like family phosphatase)